MERDQNMHINIYNIYVCVYILAYKLLGAPSDCRDLRVKETPQGGVLEWSRPYIPGRLDLYYDVYISESGNTGNDVKFNKYPIVSDSARVEYTLSGLEPLTKYQVKVSVNNGVSGSYELEKGGVCEVSWTTSNYCEFLMK